MERKTGPVRNSDPATSHLAAAGVGPSISTVRGRVLELLKGQPDGVTHDQLIALYRKQAFSLGWPPASDSSIRTRCNELWKDGEVERVQEVLGRSNFRRASLLWRAVDVQRKETA